MVDWKFYIDSPQKRALYACEGSLTEGAGRGYGISGGWGWGNGDGDCYGNGEGWGYGDLDGDGYGAGNTGEVCSGNGWSSDEW